MYKLLKQNKVRLIVISIVLILLALVANINSTKTDCIIEEDNESIEYIEPKQIEAPQVQSVPQTTFYDRDIGEPRDEDYPTVAKKEFDNSPLVHYAGGAPIDIDFLAKLMWAEGGTMSWEGQVLLCSAILNLCDMTGKSVWEAGHTYNMFSVAYYVDDVTPSNTQYEVMDYVFNGGRNDSVCYFRTGHYHNFGTPYCCIDGVYFSSR